ncbi:carbohydrate ABC transporter permease [Collinsella intestinalis]|uniref:carbohydrate ABC transporter permease n=1 Tax=Collinsella intestinalis TaxID=147207 RepID=UPI001958C299|nr:carbohydrate ABC transporter permease [Collinsella intestinalis]
MMPFTKRKTRVAGIGRRTSRTGLIATYAVLIMAAVVVGFPVLFSFSLSFTPLSDIINGIYIPTSLYLENYVNAFEAQPFAQFIVNSFVVGIVGTALQIVFSMLAAYALVFIPFGGKRIIFLVIMATMMIPAEVLVVTNFQTIRAMGLIDTYAGLILPGVATTFGIFLYRQNMMQIPGELKEASDVAGLSRFQFFIRVVVPMVKNTTVTLAIYFFLVTWNAYLWPLISTTNDTARTVQIGLRTLNSSEGMSDFGMMAAGAVITSIPTLALIFFGQKRLQEGMTKGALK